MTTTGTPLTSATGIDCVCYLAKDFVRAKNFYQNTLGLKPSMDGDNWVEFDLSDGVFTSITFYPSVLEGRSVKLFIPKTEVLSIMILENYQDRAVLGFHPPEPRA